MLSENMQQLRKMNHMSQEALADIAGVSRQTYAKWESGEAVPDILSCHKIADVFGVNLDDLVNYEGKNSGLPVPPKGKHFFGMVKVGERGQIVIPKKARDIFGIHSGDELVLLGDEAQGLALTKADVMVSFLEQVISLRKGEKR